MMIALLVAGVCAILAGAVAIAYGLLLELSFGNTLVMAGAFGVCSGIIVLAQALVVHELRNIARRLAAGAAAEPRLRPVLAPAVQPGPAVQDEPEAFPSAPAEQASASGSPLPWREDGASRDRTRQDSSLPSSAPEQAEPVTPARRRNLLFESSVRKDRERSAQQAGEGAPPDRANPPAPAEPQPANFDDAWPRPERPRPFEPLAPRRANRTSAPNEAVPSNAGQPAERPAQPARKEEAPPVTVIKSGVVDGMAYSLYSDGSIEAQMPEGMMRFASIDELRAHLDQRP